MSGPLCVAVDSAGDVITATNPTGGEQAWTVTHVDEHVIRAISCASTSLCIAVDTNGNVIDSAEPTRGEHAWAPADVDGETPIVGISCPSTSLCVAVDGGGNVLSSTDPTEGVGAWSATQVDEHVLGGVSCSSESLCVMFDGKGNVLTSTEPTKGKSAWSAAHVDPANFLGGVSCTTGLCVAVNGNGDAFSSTNPTTGAASWSNAHVDSANPVRLLGVSCPSTGLCVAVDDKNDVLSSTNPTGGAQAWGTRSLGAEEGPLLGLSCPSTSLCVAGGEAAVFTSTDPANSGTWTKEIEWVFPVPDYGEGEEIFGPFASVSCGSVSLCVASLDTYDEYDELQSSTDPLGGEDAWTNPGFDVSGGNRPPPHDEDPVLGVSCAASLCAAVDLAGNVLTAAEPGSGKNVATVAPVDTKPLLGISCPSASLCVAVDSAGNVLVSTDPTGGAGAWSVTNVDGSNRLTAVSCVSGSLCVATDAAGDMLSSTDPAGGAGAWSAVLVDPDHAFTSVSCTPAASGLCVAVDNAGYAVMSTFSPQTGGEHNGGDQNGSSESSGGQSGGPNTSTGPSLPIVVSGVFRILGVKVEGNGQIVLTLAAPGAGSFNALATAAIGKAAADSRKATSRKAGRGRKITYGTGSAMALGAGSVTVTIKPTKSALGALKSSRTLRVPVTVVFHPRGGSPTTASETVTARYQPRRSRACSASKGACRGRR